jgi:uncharacterized protein YprB with RNaseH-like and TPR domain
MSTIKRLQRLSGDIKPDWSQPAKDETISELRRRMEAIMARRHVSTSKPSPLLHGDPLSLKSLIRGDEVENDHGKFFLAHDLIHGSYRHGFQHLRGVSDLSMKAVSLLANNSDMMHFDYTNGLFLDTETTGLAGGTGTLPFLIGMGWFDRESFVIQQIFVRDFTEERASLSFLLDLLKTKRFLVTFNGKAFDIGLLSTRLIMNRFHDSLSGLAHLDLLHPSRRLLGHRTDNNRLVTLEETILGIRREGDLPGSEIPQRYFNWLRTRDARYMADVFEHNRLDVLSMVTLTIHLSELLHASHSIDVNEHHDLIAASRLLLDRGKIQEARGILEPLIYSGNLSVACESRKILSLIFKRAGLWDEAINVWEMMIADDPGNIFATEELAKWYEHKKRDFKKAHDLVYQVLRASRNMSGSERDSINHRLKRLQIRIGI